MHPTRLAPRITAAVVATILAPAAAPAQQVATGAAPAASAASADSAPPADLAERIDALDQKIRVLERLRELEAEAAAARAKEAPTFTAGTSGFALRSAAGAFQIRFRGYTQADGRFFGAAQSSPLSNTFTMRRVRPILEGTLYRNVDFRVMPDFGGGSAALFDAYLDIRFHPALALRAGKFKPPVGLERLQSATDILFVERGLPTNLVPSRDIGIQLSGEIAGGTLAWQAGLFNGASDLANGDNDNGNGKDADARIIAQPFRTGGPRALAGLAVGVAGSHGIQRGTAASAFLPTYRSPAQQGVFSYRTDGTPANTATAFGEHTRVAPQGYYYAGPFGLMGEFVRSRQEVRRDSAQRSLSHDAWQLSASWVLTGEKSGFRGITPRTPFDPASGQWGALELGARVGTLSLDRDAFPLLADSTKSAQRVRAWGVALNWYLARGVRVQTNYERSRFTGGAATGDRAPENAFLTRFQVAF